MRGTTPPLPPYVLWYNAQLYKDNFTYYTHYGHISVIFSCYFFGQEYYKVVQM